MAEKGTTVKFKNETIHSMVGDGEIRLLTEGRYMDGNVDITVNRNLDDEDEGKVVSGGLLVSQTSLNVTENNTYDTTTNDEVVVEVENSYSASDEGKVVDGGELVAQGSQTITENGTYDTTLISELIANIEGGGGDDDKIPNEYQKVDWVKTGSTFSCISAFGYDMRENDVVEFYAQADDWTQASSGKAYYAILAVKETLTSGSGARGWIGVANTLEKAIFTQFATLYGDNLEYSKAASSSMTTYGSVADSNAKVLLKFSPQADAVPRALFVGGYSSTEYAKNTKIYKITVKRADGTLVMNLIPCYRKADSVVGMFETKTWRFITASSGTFTCGTDS